MDIIDFRRVKIEIATQVITEDGTQVTLKKGYWVLCSGEALD